MKKNLIMLPGRTKWDFGSDIGVVRAVAAEYGWQIEVAKHPEEALRERNPDSVAAVLLDRGAFGNKMTWPEAIRKCRLVLPHVPIVTCHGFVEQIDWGELCDLGTFHAIRTPMSEGEVRQSLGFLWEAEQRAAAFAEARMPVSIPVRQSDRAREFHGGFSYAAG